jgi:MFS family permease
MSRSDLERSANPHLMRSLVSVIVGSMLLRAAAGAMGENIQYYFNSIHEAAKSLDHPLRAIAGAHNIYEISYAMGGIIIGTFFAAELIGAPLFGAWSDRYGRKLFIIFGPLFGAVAVQITAMTTVIWMLIFTRLLEGLSTASNAPATLGYIAESTAGSQKLRSRVTGLFEVATIGGMALGFSIGGWMWRHFGAPAIVAGLPLTSPAFAIDALIYLASLLVLWLGMSEVRGQRQRPAQTKVRDVWKHYWHIVSSPRVAGFAPAWIAINAVLGAWINLVPRVLTDKTRFHSQLLVGKFDSFQAGNIVAGYAVVFVVGIVLWTLLFPRANRPTVMLIGAGGLFTSCFLLFALNRQPSLDAPLVLPLALMLVLSIIVQSGFTPAALAHLADITEEYTGDRGAIMGLYSVFLGLGQFIGSSLGGPFVDWRGAYGIVLITLLFGLVAAVMLVRLYLQENRRPADGRRGRRAEELAAGD